MSILVLITTLKVLITLHPTLSNGNQVPHYVHYDCPRSDYTYTAGGTFEANLKTSLLNILPANASLTGITKLSFGEEGVDQVNALAYCRADFKGRDCRGCVEAAARTVIQRCRFLKEGIVWYEECTVRYANQSAMFSIDNLEVIPNHREYNFSGTFRYLEQHETIFNSLMDRLVHEAAYGRNQSGFATGKSNISTTNLMLRGLVQCRPDIVGGYCETCLRQALRQRDGWNTPMVFLPSCTIRFDLYPYAQFPSSPEGDYGVALKIIVPVVVVCVLVLCCIIFLVIYCRHRRNLQGRHRCQYEQDHPRKFSYLELVLATGCFSKRRILGKGGFGLVYKGTLLDGTQVAVKRLNNVRGALQGDAEFVAEVTAIKHLKHDNVVSLEGYCNFFRERMVVYKFVDNKTLEYHLLGDNDNDFSWEKRMGTALSLAEVFAFMHERNPAVIHRDIKPSNILIDGEFQPKVGDFGIAKLCPDSRTHVTTIIRGSLGYVDPYYYTSEHLTRKSDVFAFGVVLLQMITGRKAISTIEEYGESRHIVGWVEPLIKEALTGGNFESFVDQNLVTTYDRDEMDRMTTCATACVRNKPDERPTMRQVAEVLKDDSNDINRELKERLMGYWLSDDRSRMYGENDVGPTNGWFDSESPSTNNASTQTQESREIYYSATSPIVVTHNSATSPIVVTHNTST